MTRTIRVLAHRLGAGLRREWRWLRHRCPECDAPSDVLTLYLGGGGGYAWGCPRCGWLQD